MSVEQATNPACIWKWSIFETGAVLKRTYFIFRIQHSYNTNSINTSWLQ